MSRNRIRKNQISYRLQVPAGSLGYSPFDRWGAMIHNRSKSSQEVYLWLGALPLEANGAADSYSTPIEPSISGDPSTWSPTQVAHSILFLQTFGFVLGPGEEVQFEDGNVQPIYWAGPSGGANPAELVGWR